MSGFLGLGANTQHRTRTWSAGAKLIVVCVLALLMNIPGLFVQGLVTDRMTRAAEAAARIGGPATTVTVDAYQSVNRSLKYVLLFEGLVFLTYFTFEVTSRKRVHPAQYVLVGVAQIIFYLLLLSLSEKVGFDVGFLIAGLATVALLSVNANWIFRSRGMGLRAFAVFTPLYGLIYVLLRLKDWALLVGAVASFGAVAAAMYLTREIDWYGTLSTTDERGELMDTGGSRGTA
jgi:inner membrane protein